MEGLAAAGGEAWICFWAGITGRGAEGCWPRAIGSASSSACAVGAMPQFHRQRAPGWDGAPSSFTRRVLLATSSCAPG